MVNKMFLDDLLEEKEADTAEPEIDVDTLDIDVDEEDGKAVPKADSGVASVIDSAERMVSLANNPDLLRSILDVLDLNTGISENPAQIEKLNRLKGLIVKKLDNDSNVNPNINENAACGVTASTCIGAIPTPIGSKKKKPIRRKLPSLDVVAFTNCIKENAPAIVKTSGSVLKNNVVYGHSVLTVDGKVYPYLSKEKICEAVDDIHRRFERVDTLPACITPLDFYLLESEKLDEATVTPTPPQNSTNSNKTPDPTKESKLDQQVGKQNIATIDNTEQANNDVKINQELVGVDSSDPKNKKYILKDPQTGKIMVKNSSEIEIQNEAYQHYRKRKFW